MIGIPLFKTLADLKIEEMQKTIDLFKKALELCDEQLEAKDVEIGSLKKLLQSNRIKL